MKDLYGIPEQAIDPESYNSHWHDRQERRDARADERNCDAITAPESIVARSRRLAAAGYKPEVGSLEAGYLMRGEK